MYTKKIQKYLRERITYRKGYCRTYALYGQIKWKLRHCLWVVEIEMGLYSSALWWSDVQTKTMPKYISFYLFNGQFSTSFCLFYGLTEAVWNIRHVFVLIVYLRVVIYAIFRNSVKRVEKKLWEVHQKAATNGLPYCVLAFSRFFPFSNTRP